MRRALVFYFSPAVRSRLRRVRAAIPDPVVCLEAGSLVACTPAYEPTYDNLYANTFQPTCAKSGFSCHSPDGHQGGLNFFDKEAVYSQLHDTHAVRPGNPECSTIVANVKSLDPLVRMPPGKSIPEGEQCAIIEWVRNGAKR